MKKFLVVSLVLGVFVCAVLLSCATVNKHQPVEQFVYNGMFEQAIAELEASKGNVYPEKDIVLYSLDTGLLNHYLGNYDDSYTRLSNAEQKIYDLYSTSVTQSIGNYLVNDLTSDYAGEDYEDIYINVFNTLNFIQKNNMESAFVEIRRFDNKQKLLLTKYAEELEKAKSEAKTTRNTKVEFHNSALARYISMLMYRSDGQDDSAEIDRKMITQAFQEQPNLYFFPEPENLDEELNVPNDKARLNFISFTGFSPIKEELVERESFHSIGGGTNQFKIAIPVMVLRPSIVLGVKVDVKSSTGEVVYSSLLNRIESIEKIAFDTFTSKAALIYFRAFARAITKTAGSEALSAGSDNASGTVGAVLSLLSLASKVSNEVSERADTRISRYFPGNASVGGVTLEPGDYEVTFTYLSVSGSVLKTEVQPVRAVKSQSLNIAESICLN